MRAKIKSILYLGLCLGVFMLSVNASPVLVDEKGIEEITKKVFASVVKVEAVNGMRKVATGVVIDKKGHIVTTALISPRDEDIFVITVDGEKVKAEFLGMDPVTHLAVVKAEGKKWTAIDWGDSRDLSPGSWVGVVSISPENTAAVTQGIVSSVSSESLRLNVWVVPGSSGSPVIDKKGRLVGLVRGTYNDEVTISIRGKVIASKSYSFSREESPSSALAMAVPVDLVKKVSKEIKEKGKVQRGWLGVYIGENEDGEVEVVEVEKDSPADTAGLKKDDIILKFKDMEITGSKMLRDKIRMHKPGDKVAVVVDRNGKEMKISVKLGEYSEANIIHEFESSFPRLFPSEPFKAFPKDFKFDVIPRIQKPFLQFWGERKYIGVSLQELNPELAEYFGVEEGTGLLITKVTKDSPADEAGLKVGDVILSAEGKKVNKADKLSNMIQEKEKGEVVKLQIIRDKKKRTIEVKVEEDEGEGVKFSWKSSKQHFEKAEKMLKEYQKKAEAKYKSVEKLYEENKKKTEATRKSAERMYQKLITRYRCIEV
jgi:S1-C subfamily serine protease